MCRNRGGAGTLATGYETADPAAIAFKWSTASLRIITSEAAPIVSLDWSACDEWCYCRSLSC